MMKRRSAYLGAQIQSLTPDLASAYGLPGPWGSIVLKVVDSSPAAQADLRPGDIITSIGEKFAADTRALLRDIVDTLPGNTVVLGVFRDGKQITVPVTLAEIPTDGYYGTFLDQPGAPKPELPSVSTTDFGLEMAAITSDLRSKYKLADQQKGVLITGVAVGSTAANAEINAGSVIVQVRGTAVGSPDEVTKNINDERQQKRPFVPMLLAEPAGLRWVSLQFD
jgi:serine protease Do